MKAAEILWQLIFGLCAGCTVAAGLFTFIVTLGIVTRLSQVTKSAAFIHWYENSFIVGGIVGNLLWIYREWFSLLPESKISACPYSWCLRLVWRHFHWLPYRIYCRNSQCVSYFFQKTEFKNRDSVGGGCVGSREAAWDFFTVFWLGK